MKKGASKGRGLSQIDAIAKDMILAKNMLIKMAHELESVKKERQKLLEELRTYKKTAEYVKVANYLEEKGLAPLDVIRMIREGKVDDETFDKYAQLLNVDINLLISPHEHAGSDTVKQSHYASELRQREMIRMLNLMSRINDIMHQP